jgi:hypothetical protein
MALIWRHAGVTGTVNQGTGMNPLSRNGSVLPLLGTYIKDCIAGYYGLPP